MTTKHINSVKSFYDVLRWVGIDVASADGTRLRQRIAFLLEKCCPDVKLPLLDMGCGNGRYAVELAKMGYKVIGIDFDQKSIENARELAYEHKVKVNFICADLAEIGEVAIKSGFGLAFSVQCFQHLNDRQRDACLREVRKLLGPSGKLFVEMPYLPKSEPTKSGQDELGEYIQSWQSWYDANAEVRVTEMTFTRKKDGLQRRVTSRSKVYSPDGIQQLLRSHGFRAISIYGDWDGRPISDECCRMIFMARLATK